MIILDCTFESKYRRFACILCINHLHFFLSKTNTKQKTNSKTKGKMLKEIKRKIQNLILFFIPESLNYVRLILYRCVGNLPNDRWGPLSFNNISKIEAIRSRYSLSSDLWLLYSCMITSCCFSLSFTKKKKKRVCLSKVFYFSQNEDY